MIDSCGLHIGCLLTCTSGVNVYTVELLATVTGTHTIEYHFLSRVIRFDIEATIGQQFEIPTSYFNESGDARIKIILPSGAYFTYTDGTTVYDTFYLTVRSSQDSNFIPPVLPSGLPFATQAYVTAAIAALGIPFTHSLVEQVWPFEKEIGDETIYVKTWSFVNVSGAQTLTGLTPDTTILINHYFIKTKSTGNNKWVTQSNSPTAPAISSDPYTVGSFGNGLDIVVRVWYTKP